MRPHEIRVRYGETDKMGVVHHSVYALYFEEARTEMMRQLGVPYAELEAEGFLLPLIEVGIRFRKGPRYDDVLVLEAHVIEVGRVRVRIGYRVHRKRDGAFLAEGFTVHACVDERMRPVRMPDRVITAFRRGRAPSGEEDPPSSPRQR